MGVILVGVDGNEPAAQAALTAARLAAAQGWQLRVVCAYGKFEVERIDDDPELTFTTAEEARAVAGRVITRIQALFPAIDVQAHPASGKPADALLAVAEQVEADLIVVGNRRVQGAARILGSIATEVARKAPCDVYIAHTHTRR